MTTDERRAALRRLTDLVAEDRRRMSGHYTLPELEAIRNALLICLPFWAGVIRRLS